MVTYFLERKLRGDGAWKPTGLGRYPKIDAAIEFVAAQTVNAEFRVRGVAAELQPDGTITRRELSPEELADAIRGEQEATPEIRSVVVVWDEGCEKEAVYVDGTLWLSADLTEDDAIDANGLETIAAGQPITIRARQIDRQIEDWPTHLADLRIDG